MRYSSCFSTRCVCICGLAWGALACQDKVAGTGPVTSGSVASTNTQGTTSESHSAPPTPAIVSTTQVADSNSDSASTIPTTHASSSITSTLDHTESNAPTTIATSNASNSDESDAGASFTEAVASSAETLDASTESGSPTGLPDVGSEGDGDFTLGPDYTPQPELEDQGAPKGRRFQFSMRLADSEIFNGKDTTLDPSKPVNEERSIVVYVPAEYVDGSEAPLLVIQDGPGDIGMVQNALDNLTVAEDPERRLPAFIAVAVQNGGNDAQGSQRGLEYDTMSDRYARFIDEEVLPAVVANAEVHAAFPNLRFTRDPSGRAALGCSSGGAAALTMGWFRPDLFGRIITYSGTFVDQQDHDAPEVATYPDGAWGYHSNQQLIQTTPPKPLRIFLNVNESDLRASDPESTLHNWVMANERTAAALAEKGYHYRFVYGRGVGHCDGSIRRATLADALIWAWRGYQPGQQ